MNLLMNPYVNTYNTGAYGTSYLAGAQAAGAGIQPIDAGMQTGETAKTGAILNPGESTRVAPGKTTSPAECQTCKERKYQDGSDEMVSFKSAAHISPESAATRVRAHEQEHVNNAYKKAAQGNGKVLSATVSLRSAICPECGRSYIAGGTTRTKIQYPNESNPYQRNRKAADASATTGGNVDLAV